MRLTGFKIMWFVPLLAGVVTSCSFDVSNDTFKKAQDTKASEQEQNSAQPEAPAKDSTNDARPVILEFTNGAGTVFAEPEALPQHAVLLGDDFALLGSEANRFNKSGELVGRMGITNELAAALSISDAVIIALAPDLAWAVAPTKVTAVLARDPAILVENRRTTSIALPDLPTGEERKLIGISLQSLFFLEKAAILDLTLAAGKLAVASISLPPLAKDERVIAAGRNDTVMWLATSQRILALIDSKWNERVLEWNGVSDLHQIAFAAFAFSGATFPEWKIAAGVVVDKQDVKFSKQTLGSFKKPGGGNSDDGGGKPTAKLTWISDVRLLSDLYCVQCHTWADKEVEWIKRLSDIRQRTLPSAVSEAKTMPQLNSVPADKITEDERMIIINWLDQQKSGG